MEYLVPIFCHLRNCQNSWMFQILWWNKWTEWQHKGKKNTYALITARTCRCLGLREGEAHETGKQARWACRRVDLYDELRRFPGKPCPNGTENQTRAQSGIEPETGDQEYIGASVTWRSSWRSPSPCVWVQRRAGIIYVKMVGLLRRAILRC